MCLFGGVTRKPSRYTELNLQEEACRFKLTLQAWDRILYKAAFASQAELKTAVANPASFQELRAETVLIFSDQIPFWVKIGHTKQLVAAWETGDKNKVGE